ncbi:MAG: phosphatase PAP2 family protein [Acidimicrobiales bacterium]
MRLENESLGGVVRRSGAVAMPSRRRPLPVRFVMEFGLMGALLALYLLLRFSMKGSIGDAVGNAHRVVQVERAFGVFSESNLQSLALHSHDVILFLNAYYLLAHFTITGLFFAWMLIRHPDSYPGCRRILIVMTAIGLGIHAIYPLAPPRMLPDMGFIDTGRLFGPSPYGDTSKGLANQFAAMPSLHFGWALLVAWGATRFSTSKLRRVMWLHPLLTLAAIIITANHYWLDAAVALCIFLAALNIDRALRRRFLRLRGTESLDDATARDPATDSAIVAA